mmetsp:Transcript_53762/g.78820  ORF Transcript_53762/g.78820 Transcript_53762/m.78820 type:complete len:99 (+) Transcript_53762:261-557(+)
MMHTRNLALAYEIAKIPQELLDKNHLFHAQVPIPTAGAAAASSPLSVTPLFESTAVTVATPTNDHELVEELELDFEMDEDSWYFFNSQVASAPGPTNG